MPETIRQFLDACHPFGYPLLACSVLLIAAILYHLIFVGRSWHRTLAQIDFALQHPTDAEKALREYSLQHHDSLTEVILSILNASPDASMEKVTEARLIHAIDSGRSGLALISIITNIAPMLGILGTAWGLVDIFGVFGSSDAQAGIAMGISKALYTTIFGLAIAVPGVIAGTCFERRLENRAARINESFTTLLNSRQA
ncbi:MAG: MotA/TolQ/ExbB proton channel family protein [Akkermansiaceae bacterium]|nr:MotA/TolQ/ExbB proton channel family protein [Akkermansiaceae bacterium]